MTPANSLTIINWNSITSYKCFCRHVKTLRFHDAAVNDETANQKVVRGVEPKYGVVMLAVLLLFLHWSFVNFGSVLFFCYSTYCGLFSSNLYFDKWED